MVVDILFSVETGWIALSRAFDAGSAHLRKSLLQPVTVVKVFFFRTINAMPPLCNFLLTMPPFLLPCPPRLRVRTSVHSFTVPSHLKRSTSRS